MGGLEVVSVTRLDDSVEEVVEFVVRVRVAPGRFRTSQDFDHAIRTHIWRAVRGAASDRFANLLDNAA